MICYKAYLHKLSLKIKCTHVHQDKPFSFGNNADALDYVSGRISKGQPGNSSFPQKYFDLFISSPYNLPPSPSSGNVSAALSFNFNAGQRKYEELELRFSKFNLSEISKKCSRDTLFANFNPDHRSASRELTEVFLNILGSENGTDILDIAEYFKKNPNIHPKIWYESFWTGLLLQRPNLLQVNKPSSYELFPTTFFPTAVLETKISGKECVLLDERIGYDNGFENWLWYFREDIQLNAHHWMWHLLHPIAINKIIDRRGESFYFIHHELLARYNAERLSNGLRVTKPLNLQLDTVLEEGYKPHLRDGISSFPWTERKPFSKLFEALNSTMQERLVKLITERNRVLETLAQGGVVYRNGFLEIHDKDYINILGELTEASNQSINSGFYGMDGYHNEGHFLFSLVDALPGMGGVLADLASTMRDPMFYRWHQYVDLIFQAYKITLLKPYTPYGGKFPLVFEGIQVKNVVVVREKDSDKNQKDFPPNHLDTFWSFKRIDLGDGIDFNPNKTTSTSPAVSVCAKHLNHDEFYYQIEIENFLEEITLATLRIFMAPRYKSEDKKIRYTMSEQRSLFFTMDSFQAVLKPGDNVLIRRSIDSTLTADWPKSIKELREELTSNVSLRSVCECGFPYHLLLPKGTEEGMIFDLFLMITNGVEDLVRDNSTIPDSVNENENFISPSNPCPPSHIHCGLPGRKYPDAKPMGYPFDRKPYSKPIMVSDFDRQATVVDQVVHNLEAYVKDIPNMYATQIIVQHHDEIRENEYFIKY